MNWGELKAAVAAYTHRNDLDAMFPVWIAAAEQRIYFGELNTEPLRIAPMCKTVTLSDGNRPLDFLEAKKICVSGDPRKWLNVRPMEHLPDETRAYAWDGETLVLSKDMSFPLDMSYYARFPTPVADGDTNWLLANAPNVYLSAISLEVGRWSRDYEMGVLEAGNYTSAITSLLAADRKSSISGSLAAAQPQIRVA